MAKTDENKKQQDEAAAKRAAYNAAEQRLKTEYQAEFRAFVQEEAEKRGVTYEFRLSPEEKAAKQLADLIQQFPDLKDQYLNQQG